MSAARAVGVTGPVETVEISIMQANVPIRTIRSARKLGRHEYHATRRRIMRRKRDKR